MNSQPCWRDVESAASRLTEGDRRTLLLLVHLPLIWEAAIERLFGLRGGASVFRCLARLRSMGLVGELRVARLNVRRHGCSQAKRSIRPLRVSARDARRS